MTNDALEICPFCSSPFVLGAATCPSCDLPLLANGDPAASEPARVGSMTVEVAAHPEFAVGGLRRVAIASNQAEAEMVEGLLRSEGIPCIVQRSPGADVPDFLAAGRRDILVPEGGLAAARDLLQITAPAPGSYSEPSPLLLGAAVLGGMVLMVLFAALIVMLA